MLEKAQIISWLLVITVEMQEMPFPLIMTGENSQRTIGTMMTTRPKIALRNTKVAGGTADVINLILMDCTPSTVTKKNLCTCHGIT